MRFIFSVIIFTLILQSSFAQLFPFDTVNTSKEEVFGFVDEPASFPGGLAKFYEYVGKNIHYPKDAISNGIEGKVFVEFIIDPSGEIRPNSSRIIKGIYPSCDSAVVNVIQNSPKWIPALKDSRPVAQKMAVPIIFNNPKKKK